MVAFSENRKKGELAAASATSNYKNTLKGMKRLVGLSFDDPKSQTEMSFMPGVNFVPIPHSDGSKSIGVEVMFDGTPTVLPLEAIAGMMIKHLGEIAAAKDSTKLLPQDWVIAIPNYFTDAQRRALLIGCDIVGIPGVQRLMHENTATALAYGIFKDLKKVFSENQPTNVMFIDIGASAYTVSIAAFEPGKLMVKSAFCDANLGGRDFDMVIATWIAEKFAAKYKNLSMAPMENPKTLLKLLSAAEKAKKTLSPQGVREARLNIEMLMDDYDFHIGLQAAEYEKLCEPLLKRLDEPIQAALAEAKLTAQELEAVEIVGGSTRIGCVKRHLTKLLGKELSTTLNADECVARGAALQSAILSPRFKVLPYDIHEAQPYPIQLSWHDDQKEAGMEVDTEDTKQPTDSVIMFDRGLSFPVVRRVTLRRSGTFQVKAVYDDSATQFGLTGGKDIAVFAIQAPEGDEKKVRINVKEDIHGIIHMSSAQMVEEIEEEEKTDEEEKTETKEGEEQKDEKKKKIKKTNLEFTVTRPLDWSKAEIEKAYEAEVAMANHDRIHKETADMRNELESYIYDMRDKIMSDNQLGPYGTEPEKAAFMGKNEATENWLYDEGFDATKSVYHDKLAELKQLGGPIERRAYEAQARPAAVNSLQANLEVYKNWVNDSQTNERYEHITDEEREKVRTVCDEVSAWMYDMLDKQGGMGSNEDPKLTVADLQAKNKQLADTCTPIMNKPVPKRKKEEPKKEEQPAAPEEDKKQGDGPEPMEGVEKEQETAADADTPAENGKATPMEED